MFRLRSSTTLGYLRNVQFYQQIKSLHEIRQILTDWRKLVDKDVEVTGWVKNIRDQKEHNFLHLHDGTDSRHLQLVFIKKEHDNKESIEDVWKKIFFGTSIKAAGTVVKSTGKMQDVELKVKKLEIIGDCDPEKYPFRSRQSYSLENLRQYPHLRTHNDLFAAIMRFRNTLTMSLHKFFQNNRYIHIHTPVLTKMDCEGGAEVFNVSTKNDTKLFFDHPVYLITSAQLHLESCINSLAKVYTISPTFRAEKSMTRHHLSEFYMIEAESTNAEKLDDLLGFVENLVKFVNKDVFGSLETHELSLLKQRLDGERPPNTRNNNNTMQYIEKILKSTEKDFIRIRYSDAIKLLNEKFKKLEALKFGDDFGKAHEKSLLKYFDNHPVFITHYPKKLKPFYMRQSSEDENLVENFDLLVENVGELVGGSLREHRYDKLIEAIKSQNINMELDSYKLYLETKQFGNTKMGGFGIGMERYIQYLLNIHNIKDTCLYPRFWGDCKM